MKMLAVFALVVLVAVPAFGQSKEYQAPPPSRAAASTDQIIVKWRDGSRSIVGASSGQRSNKLSSAAGVSMQFKRSSSPDMEVFKLDRVMELSELQSVLTRLNADPSVAFAVADQRRQAEAVPSDPMFADQWYLASAQPAATRSDRAWDVTTGNNTTVIAVLDSGVRPDHPDLAGKLLPGYDFVTEPLIANDGNGRDDDPTDPGDWVNAADRTQAVFRDCQERTSSWHGTRVAGLIGASTNDGVGLAGATWTARLLPVRVLGKCGGYDSDIIDAMRWAAGLTVNNVPDNPNPARIINLSLGGESECNAAYRQAVSEVTARGALIVASVGNDGLPVNSPANCDNVLGVSGVRHTGTKVGYSNLGPGADIAAPAGNCVNTGPYTPSNPCVYSLVVAVDSGDTTPAAPTYTDNAGRANFGTSFSAPLVAGAAALMNAVNPKLTPAQFTTLLQESSTAFPTSSSTTTDICRVPTNVQQGAECICTTSTCGSGMLNTAAAVAAALKPFGVIQANAVIDPNVGVNIAGSSSFGAPGHTVASYQWSILNVTGATPTIADTAASTTTLQVSGNSRFTLRLRVTDDAGTTDDTDFAMVTTTSPDIVTPPASTPIGPRGRGGGGNFDWWLLFLGLLPLALPGPRRRKAVRVRWRCLPRNLPSISRGLRRRRRQQVPQ